MKALNLLRVVAHTDWSANGSKLLRLYWSHVQSKLDFGSIVYGSARASLLQAPNCVQSAVLRICLGVYRTSPVASLHIEAGEMLLSLKLETLALQYMVKLKCNPSNPVYN
jgi:hypothetical protein